MGNHEFCTLCHENDFHYGKPCNPTKRAKVLADEARYHIIKVNAIKYMEEILIPKITELGIEIKPYLNWDKEAGTLELRYNQMPNLAELPLR